MGKLNGRDKGEQRFALIVEHMLEGCAYCRMLYDDAGRADDFIYLAVNPAFERLTGLKDVVGKRVTEVIPGIRHQTPELFDLYGRVVESGEPGESELDFTPLGLQLHLSVFRPEPGHFVAVFADVTERKRDHTERAAAEAALHESEELYRSILKASPDDITVTDLEGNILLVSPAAVSMLGHASGRRRCWGVRCRTTLRRRTGSGPRPTSASCSRASTRGRGSTSRCAPTGPGSRSRSTASSSETRTGGRPAWSSSSGTSRSASGRRTRSAA